MSNCSLCDQYISISKRLGKVDLPILKRYHDICKECDEFCKDSQRLLGKVPFVNCPEYKKYSALSKLAIDRQQAKLKKSALAMAPFMSQPVARKVLTGILKQAPSHPIVLPPKRQPIVPPGFLLPQAPKHKPIVQQPKVAQKQPVGKQPVVVKKPCNPNSEKAKDPKYECNPITGRWVLKKK